MSMKRRLFLLHQRVVDPNQKGPGLACVRAALALPGWAYGAASHVRNLLYDRSILKAHRAEAPVISIGNITAGGTGKTPLVAWLTRLLAIHKTSPAVLSRGYGSDAQTGVDDENELLARKIGQAPVQVNPDRVAGAEAAVRGGADVLVLDDGFQHRRLARDLDVVLIDATLPFGGGHMLPRGLLREPPSGLKRADFLVLTRANLVSEHDLETLQDRLESLAPGVPRAICGLSLTGLLPLGGAPELPLEALAEGPWLAFCGIGNPDGFRRTLSLSRCEPAEFRAFADHEPYSRETLDTLLEQARASHCRALVCTEKDAVKVERLLREEDSPPVYAASAELSFGKGRSRFVGAVMRAIGRTARCVPA